MDFKYEESRIYLEDENGKMIAEITFPQLTPEIVNLNHTFVDDSLRGQGIAGKLMQAAVEVIAKRGQKIFPSCSYSLHWLEKNSEYSDMYVKSL